MTKGCDIEKHIDIKENPVQVTKERCSISQKLISKANSLSKSNTEWIAELKKVRINNIKNVIIATSSCYFVDYITHVFNLINTYLII